MEGGKKKLDCNVEMGEASCFEATGGDACTQTPGGGEAEEGAE